MELTFTANFRRGAPSMTLKVSLTSIPAFRFVSPEAATSLSSIARIDTREKGDAIVLSGEDVSAIYVVAEGMVGVFPPGVAKPIAELGPGDCFGEMSFIESSQASATIRAVQNGTKLIRLRQDELHQLSRENAELGAAIFRGIALTLSKKLRATTSRIAEELAVGRRMLEEFNVTDSDDPIDLQALPQEIVRQHQSIRQGLNGVHDALHELSAKFPERSGTLAKVVHDLDVTRRQSDQFFLNLIRNVASLTAFLEKMEEFINNSTV
jgi:CRP-like cAMP-binding protein